MQSIDITALLILIRILAHPLQLGRFVPSGTFDRATAVVRQRARGLSPQTFGGGTGLSPGLDLARRAGGGGPMR